MRRVLTSILAAGIALLCVAVGAPVSPAQAADPVRVLLTGDSITQGRHGDFTWRYRLDREFRRQGVAVDLVGSASAVYQDPGFPTSTYADPNFDRDHFARVGWELREMTRQMGSEVREQQPDVVVLAAGINDFRHHPDDPEIVEETKDALRAWIGNVQAAKPDTRILLSPVLRVDTPAADVLNPRIDAYNSALQGIATDMQTADSRITVATTDQGWVPSGPMTWDGLHPSTVGETFIAQRIAQALRRADSSYFPQPVDIYRSTVAWPRKVRPTVKVAGNRATVSWEQHVISAGRVRLKRAGKPAITSAAFHRNGSQVLTVAPGATYDFWVQVRRGKMVGPWGPAVRVRVPAPARPAAPARVTVTAAGVSWTAAPRAASYVVKFRKIGKRAWTTRRTTGLRTTAKRVKVAQVRAVNAGGTSAWRIDYR